MDGCCHCCGSGCWGRGPMWARGYGYGPRSEYGPRRPRERQREDELHDLEARRADLQEALTGVSEAIRELREREVP